MQIYKEVMYCGNPFYVHVPESSRNKYTETSEMRGFSESARRFSEAIRSETKVEVIKASLEEYLQSVEKVITKYQPHYEIRYAKGKSDASVRATIEATNWPPTNGEPYEADHVQNIKSTFSAPASLLVKSDKRGKVGYLPKWQVEKALLKLAENGMYSRQRYARYPKNPVVCPDSIIQELRNAHLNQIPTQELVDAFYSTK